MSTASISRRNLGPQRGFASWALAMLLVVLLSAVPSGEQARTRLVGSAFDPATVSVALTPKQPKAKAAVQSSDRRRLPESAFGKAPTQLALADAATAAVAGSAAGAPRAFTSPSPVASRRALTRAHGPRAPPAA